MVQLDEQVFIRLGPLGPGSEVRINLHLASRLFLRDNHMTYRLPESFHPAIAAGAQAYTFALGLSIITTSSQSRIKSVLRPECTDVVRQGADRQFISLQCRERPKGHIDRMLFGYEMEDMLMP